MTGQDGRVALVTGAARGIGAATVRALCADRLLEPEDVAALIAFCCSPQGAVANGAVMSAEGRFRG